jgi:hypothetical protein
MKGINYVIITLLHVRILHINFDMYNPCYLQNLFCINFLHIKNVTYKIYNINFVFINFVTRPVFRTVPPPPCGVQNGKLFLELTPGPECHRECLGLLFGG